MSSSASLSSSTSSSSAPPTASAASTPFIAYDLRDGSNGGDGCESLASALVRMDPSLPIDELRKAVFDVARARLPERYDYLALDVYPPGSSSDVLSDHDLARDPEDPISSLLPAAGEQDRKKRRIILVARPLPPTAGVQGEQHRPRGQCACWSASTLFLSALLMPFPYPRCLLSCVSVCVLQRARLLCLPDSSRG
jgi:hypothetical protein